MISKTLQEICKEHGVSRRVIQGYEQYGLVKPFAKNKYGYLLYDEKMAERIAFIRFCQVMKFSLRDIGEFIDAPSKEIQQRFIEQIAMVNNEIAELNVLSLKARRIVEALNNEDYEREICEILRRNENEID